MRTPSTLLRSLAEFTSQRTSSWWHATFPMVVLGGFFLSCQASESQTYDAANSGEQDAGRWDGDASLGQAGRDAGLDVPQDVQLNDSQADADSEPEGSATKRYHVGGRGFNVVLAAQDDFSTLENWLVEGAGTVAVHNNELQWDALDTSGTIWFTTRFEGPTIVEYDVRSMNGDHNINFIFYGSIMMDGRDVLLETSDQRTGAYPEYHRFPNYIITYLDPEEDAKWRVRFRKNPGFDLLSEKNVNSAGPGDSQHVVYILEENGAMSLYVDDTLQHQFMDSNAPLREGYHAFRTFDTKLVYSRFRVYNMVP